MKIKHLSLFLFATFVVACSTTSTEPEISLPKASFTYKTEQPFKVVLTNNSSDATAYEWDFGDGTNSKDENPIHRYKSIGVYRVKLIAKNSYSSDVYQTNVEINAPSSCVMTGFSVTKIPTNNKYYQVQLTDDYIVSKTTYFYTTWFLLSSANLPYNYTLSSAKTIDTNNDYVIRLYQYSGSGNPSSGQASGKGDWYAKISSSALKEYPESITCSNSSAAINVNLKWK